MRKLKYTNSVCICCVHVKRGSVEGERNEELF